MKTSKAKDRTRPVLFFFIAVFLLVILRLAYLQLFRHSFYKDISLDQRLRMVELSPDRGDIFDRNGSILATSVDRWSIYVRPRAIKDKDKDKVISALINIFKGDEGLIRKKFSQNRGFWLKRKAEKRLADMVLKIGCQGIDVLREKKRIYPRGRLAAQLIGFAGMDNQGLSGIELGFDEYLRGSPGKYIFEKDLRGREIALGSSRQVKSSTDGINVYLTIDESIQYVAEKELRRAVKSTGSRGGSVIVMDIKTGEILAVASLPDFDPNNYRVSSPSSWKLTPVTDQYEPGSTFKVITAAAGIAEGIVKPESVIPVPDSIKVGGITIKNSHEVKRDKPYKDLKDVIAESLNTGTSYIGLKLGASRFHKYIRLFGFGSKTGIEYPGEGRGTVMEPEKWHKSDVATCTFGQSLSVTPLQLVCAIAAIANGGVRMVPKLVKRIESPDRDVVKSETPREAARVLSKDAVKNVIVVMKGAVYMKHGSGHRAKMPQFSVAGKTGTAQKAVRGVYAKGRYIASFAGFAPASKPRVAVLVTLDEPKSSIWGETTAAPAFREIMLFALRYLDAIPDM